MSLRRIDRYARQLHDRVMALEVPQSMEDRFGKYREAPVAFVREQLGVEKIEAYQVEVLEAAVEDPRIVWRAAHGVGKTTVLAWILLWWLLTRSFSRVLVLAPAFERQVGRYLMPEVKKWARRAPEPLPVRVRVNSVEVVGFEREWFALGVQASDSTMVEGGHAESLAVLADEAKGLGPDVVAALHGTQTDVGGDRLYVLASVPGGPSGPFYDAFRKGAGVWRCFATSSMDSALVSETWRRERAEEWGEGSPLYIARVLGEFPDEAEGTLYRLADLEAAVVRRIEPKPGEVAPAVTFGVDVARFGGDSSAIAVWRGPELLTVMTKRKMDVMEVAAWVASEANHFKPEVICVDVIGIGAGVADRLRQLKHPVRDVNVGSASTKPELWLNCRAEIFWQLRDALERGELSLPDDPGLLAELSALRYEYSPRGQIKLELKEETKKRVGHSPDRADAVALGYYRAAGLGVGEAFSFNWLAFQRAAATGRPVSFEEFRYY